LFLVWIVSSLTAYGGLAGLHAKHGTLVIAREENACVSLLPSWYDVDDTAARERVKTDIHLGRHTRAFLKP